MYCIIYIIMIFPIRCFTCGHIIGSKWNQYNKLIDKKYKNKEKNMTLTNYNIKNLDDNKEVFNNIGIQRYCCKRHFISHVDLYFKI